MTPKIYIETSVISYLNAKIQKRISICCIDEGYEPPIICTPEELFGV